jgi:hypothetical protein
LIYNINSKFELHPNIGKIDLIEKSSITGPNGGKIGLVAQDMTLCFFNSEKSIKGLSKVMGISEEEFKSMVEDLIEELKQTSPTSSHIRLCAQKQLSK